jgi:hypothetical protein
MTRYNKRLNVTFNVIETEAEYKAEGFENHEISLVMEHDRLYNLDVMGCTTPGERERMFELVEILGL